MKEENTNGQAPLTKNNLPEVMYPGVPVEYSEKEFTTEGETKQEREAPPRTYRRRKKEQQKELTNTFICRCVRF